MLLDIYAICLIDENVASMGAIVALAGHQAYIPNPQGMGGFSQEFC
jgi:hypothetical protein